MNKVEVVKRSQVEVEPFVLEEFIQAKEVHAIIEETSIKKVTKKELKYIASTLGLTYDDTTISFSKKLLNEYLKQMSNK